MIRAVQLPTKPEGRTILLRNVAWRTYQMLSDDLGDQPVRMTYDRGRLELMAPSFNHERSKRCIGRLVEILAEEFEQPYVSGGSTTFRREDLERGLEPDDCFYFAHAAQVLGREQIDLRDDPPPDLAIEVDITRSSLDRMNIYAALAVPEIWRYDGALLRVFRLQVPGTYEEVETSPTFPRVSLARLNEFLSERIDVDDMTLARRFREFVRQEFPGERRG